MKTLKQYIEPHWLLVENAIRKRLFDKGTYADGTKIETFAAKSGVYSPVTQNIKAEKGQPTNRVTLFDSGELYESFDMKATKDTLFVNYNDKKKDGNVSDNIPEMENAIAIGEDGVTQLQAAILPEMQQDFI